MAAHRPSLTDRVEALAAGGRVSEAYRLLTAPGAAADPQALFHLAAWRLAGHYVRRDLPAARALFGQAAALGHRDAAACHAAFLANGTGGDSDWQAALDVLGRHAARDPAFREDLALIGGMNLSAAGDPASPVRGQPLSAQPRAMLFPGLFSAAECAFLIARAAPALAPSMVIDPQSGRLTRNPVRTSDGMAFPFAEESPAIHALNRRIAAATGTLPAQGEPLQVLRYRPGQEYRPHSDAILGEPNQRILTVLVYLNQDYTGGETRFLQTGLGYKGQPGDALAFCNAGEDGRPDPFAQHAGLPVTSGEKLIASRWIRAQPFALPPPKPLLEV